MVSHKRSLDQDENEGDCSNKTIPILTATTEEVLVKKTRREGEADNVHEDDNIFHVLEHQNTLTCQMYDIVSGEEQKQIVNNSNAEGDDDLLHISNMYNALTCQLYDKLDANDSCFSDSDTDIDFDSDDEEELDDDLNTVLRSSLELLKHQHNNTIQKLESTVVENETLKAYVVSLESKIQELQQIIARGGNGSSSVNRKRTLKVVKDIAAKYINDHDLDISTRSKINNLIKDGYLDDLRELVQKEHAKLDQDHRLAQDLMTNEQLSSYIYRLTDEYREESRMRTAEKLAKKREILEDILSNLEKNAQLIDLGSDQLAYVIQCIFDVARLHPDTKEATSKMLSAILVQIQEFGDVGLEFLKSWGVIPLTEEFIEKFKADKDNWPYLQAGYYVGLTCCVEYMNVQTDGVRQTFGAWETVRGIAENLGLTPAQVRNLGAISDSMFICFCRRSASNVESALQTFFKGMYILAPRSKPRPGEVCVVSLQKVHDSGASSETVGDGNGTQANGVFLTCIPGCSARTNARNTEGVFELCDKPFIPQTPVPTFANVKYPQGFGRGGTITMPE